MNETLTSLITSGTLPAAIVLTAVVLGAMLLARGSRRTTSASGRLKDLEALREGRAPSSRYNATTMAPVGELGESGANAAVDDFLIGISELISRLPVLGGKDREKLKEELLRAGLRRDDALGVFIAAKIACAALGVAIAFGVVVWLHLFADKGFLRIAAMLGGMIFGSLIPDVALKRMITHRQIAILRNLPDALDLMVICTEAGLSLDPTVERVARELRLSAPELSREMALMSHEMRILPKREMALQNFADRNQYREVKSLMATLVQTLRYGTSLAHSLRILATESRNARMLAVEEKAARLPAMMTIPLICCMLPAVFMVIAGPAVSQVLKLMHHH
ncbi:MAG: type II secretion system F family protein [Alphaproteobacteria bacterium]